MAQFAPIAGLTASGIFSRISRLGDTAVSIFGKIWPLLADTKKGVPLAIAGIKLAQHFMIDPNFALSQLSDTVERLERFDPTTLIGQPPPNPIDSAFNAGSMIPDEDCNALDIACQIRNGFRAVVRGLVMGGVFLASSVHNILWNLAYFLISGALKLASMAVRYVVIPIVQTLIAAYNGLLSTLKNALCVYVTHVAPYLSIYNMVQDLVKGRRMFAVFDVGVGIFMPLALVSADCGFTAPIPFPAEPSPAPGPVTVPPARSPDYIVPILERREYDSIAISDTLMISSTRGIIFNDRIDILDGVIP